MPCLSVLTLCFLCTWLMHTCTHSMHAHVRTRLHKQMLSVSGYQCMLALWAWSRASVSPCPCLSVVNDYHGKHRRLSECTVSCSFLHFHQGMHALPE